MHAAQRWLVFLSAAIAALAVVLASILPTASASAATGPAAGNSVGASHPVMILAVGGPRPVSAGEHRREASLQPYPAAGACVAVENTSDLAAVGRPTAPSPDEAFHYTSPEAAQSIVRSGLRPGSHATPNGELSGLQAQIDLALSPNRALPGAVVQVNVAGMRAAGYDIPEVTQVGRNFGMPGGGWEMQFPDGVPSQFLKVVSNEYLP